MIKKGVRSEKGEINVGEWGWGVEGKQVGSMDEVTSQRLL